jgi:drug/metabolite transporter superfamily protein YnfA
MLSMLSEIWALLRSRKKFWLLPIVIVMLLFGALLIFAQSSALARLFTRSSNDLLVSDEV